MFTGGNGNYITDRPHWGPFNTLYRVEQISFPSDIGQNGPLITHYLLVARLKIK
jgi:hypothetical protein